jgi:CMP-N-acetylneuraminate monooxygenase
MRLQPVGQFEIVANAASAPSTIDLTGHAPGIHQTPEFLFRLGAAGDVEWVVSRVCDHAAGTLLLSPDRCFAKCPLHGWQLDLRTLQYTNVAVRKSRLAYEVRDGRLHVDAGRRTLRIPESAKFGGKSRVGVRFLAHACLELDIGGLKIVTDPWLVGPCFLTGWWHSIPPKADAIQRLLAADLIYVSHNHPDHMHAETLRLLLDARPDVDIVVPQFDSESVVRPLRAMGFKRVEVLSFNTLYRVNGTPTVLSILNSGDFRDDSGLFVASGDFSCLLTVDASSLNNMILPTGVDLLATSFAGGASGFPWCFEHFSIEKRQQISTRHLGAVRKRMIDYVSIVAPRSYMPYAGFFTEAASRDAFVQKHNRKNTVDEVLDVVAGLHPDIALIDPRKDHEVVFETGSISRRAAIDQAPLFQVDEDYVAGYVEGQREAAADFDLEVVARYLERSNFSDDLIAHIQPTDDDFSPHGAGLLVDFRTGPHVTVLDSEALRATYENQSGDATRRTFMRIRYPALWEAVCGGLSWEDMSIGFQCRLERRPDVYDSAFWFHFTNVYIGHVG